VIGASIGQIGTALAQQSLRAVLSFCNARQMTAPEAYIQYSPEIFTGDGQVKNETLKAFLAGYMAEFRDHIVRVLTVLPVPPTPPGHSDPISHSAAERRHDQRPMLRPRPTRGLV
jgi:chromate reductase